MPGPEARVEPYSQGKLLRTTISQPSVDVLFTPRGDVPICNQDCNGCYFFSNYRPGDRAIPAEDVPAIITGFRGEGYQNFFLISSEVLLARNWEELVKATGDKYVNTNGRIIASEGKVILDRLSEAGVNQIVMTANITDSHQDLNIVPRSIVDLAFQTVKAYNAENPDRAFTTTATAIITSENYDKVAEMCDYVHDVYEADGIKFLASLPLGEGVQQGIRSLMPSRAELAIAIEQVEAMRKRFSVNDLYIQRGGTIGSAGLTQNKLQSFCPAGDAIRSVRSVAEGAAVIPCIFIPQIIIGHMENGKIVVDEARLDEFLEFKSKAIAEGDCPAYAIQANGYPQAKEA